MKVRVGFVSNSSTSSFVCMACGNITVASMDGEETVYHDYCENGHEFCASHVREVDWGSWYFDSVTHPPSECPICTLKIVPSRNQLAFALKLLALSSDELCDAIRERFATDVELQEFLKS